MYVGCSESLAKVFLCITFAAFINITKVNINVTSLEKISGCLQLLFILILSSTQRPERTLTQKVIASSVVLINNDRVKVRNGLARPFARSFFIFWDLIYSNKF